MLALTKTSILVDTLTVCFQLIFASTLRSPNGNTNTKVIAKTVTPASDDNQVATKMTRALAQSSPITNS